MGEDAVTWDRCRTRRRLVKKRGIRRPDIGQRRGKPNVVGSYPMIRQRASMAAGHILETNPGLLMDTR